MTPSLICGIGPLGFAMGTPQPEPAETATERTPEEARQWMDEQGLSQAELARQFGVSASLVDAILRGTKPCKRGASHNIAVYLGLKRGQAVAKRQPFPAQRAAAQHAGAAA